MPATPEGGRQGVEHPRGEIDILVLHTDRTLLASLGEVLDMAGYAVATARLPERVHEQYPSPPRLAIIELTASARSLRRDPAWTDIPFIFLTADAALADPRKLRKTGTDLILTQPFDYDDLMGAVEMLLGRSLYARARADLEWAHGLTLAADEAARIPLAHVHGFAHLLRDYHAQMNPAEVQDILDVILRGTEQVIQRADDMMLITRIQSGLAKRDAGRYRARCLLRDLLTDAAADVHDRAARAGVTLKVETAGKPGAAGVPFYLRHALARILAASVTLAAGRRGEVAVDASGDRSTASLTVRIEGPGATDEEMARLFAELRSVDPAALDPEQWAGLGFGIAASLIALQGGETQVSAGPDVTEIRVTLPAAGTFH